jgi:2-polyprenyl-6-methoxyphenol hydroxylase-like FAD-dependent oxidoreductase
VLVVGAGPVGLFTALELVEAGIDLEIIDQEDRSAIHGYALALHPRTLGYLDRYGVVDQLINDGNRIRTVGFYEDIERRAELRMDSLDSRYPFALALPQSALEDCLNRLLRDRGVTVRWNHRLARLTGVGRTITATVDRLDRVSGGYPIATTSQLVVASKILRPRVVVGTDGHRSLVRRALGADFEHVAEPRMYLVFEFTADRETSDDMRVAIKDGAAAGLWPLPEQRFRWTFELGDPSGFRPRADERRLVRFIGQAGFPHVAEERLAELIAYRAPWFDSSVRDVLWSLAVRFERRVTTVMGQDRVWLAGDSAHLTLPIGMHSMNLGFAEARQLATAVSDLLLYENDERPLAPYPEDHRLQLRRLICPTEGFVAGAGCDLWVGDHLSQLVNCTPASGPELTRLLAPIGIERSQSVTELVV